MATINRLKSIMHQTVINSSIKGFTYNNVIDAISTAVNASFLKFLKQTKKVNSILMLESLLETVGLSAHSQMIARFPCPSFMLSNYNARINCLAFLLRIGYNACNPLSCLIRFPISPSIFMGPLFNFLFSLLAM